jgi:DNA polymerase-3 subunit gamma/tau
MDVLELDAASNNGVDNVRALRDEAVFTPVDVKKRVYIIDEVHMLSSAAFNALLKILEEPPEHLVFILATTEIHKVPATILSRCQRFTFKRILPEKIVQRLLYIAEQEKLSLTPDAAALLSRLGDGSLRDAISLLDQCASGDTIDTGAVLSSLGLAGSEEITRLLTAVLNGDAGQCLTLLDALYENGKVMSSLLDELAALIRDVLIEKLMPEGGSGLLSGGFDIASLRQFADTMTAERLQSMLEIVRDAMKTLSSGANSKLTCEMCLMRLCRPELDTGSLALINRITALENRLSGGFTAAPAPAAFNDAVPEPAPPPVHSAASAEDRPPVKSEPEEPVVKNTPQPAAETTKPHENSHASRQETADAVKAILQRVGAELDMPEYLFLSDETHASITLEEQALTVRAKNPFAKQMLDTPSVMTALGKAAAAVLGKNVSVKVVVDSETKSAGTDKLDALSRFSNITFE